MLFTIYYLPNNSLESGNLTLHNFKIIRIYSIDFVFHLLLRRTLLCDAHAHIRYSTHQKILTVQVKLNTNANEQSTR